MVLMNLFAGQQWRHRCSEQICEQFGRRRVGRIERTAWKYILPYVKQIASPGSMHETGCSGLAHWDDPEGWDGEEGGREDQDGEHVYTHG